LRRNEAFLSSRGKEKRRLLHIQDALPRLFAERACAESQAQQRSS
jgi:hypothetical protein